MPEPPDDLPVTAEAAKRTAVELLCREIAAGTQVEFRMWRSLWAPPQPVWFVFPPSPPNRMGASPVIAICAYTGRVLFRGRIGE